MPKIEETETDVDNKQQSAQTKHVAPTVKFYTKRSTRQKQYNSNKKEQALKRLTAEEKLAPPEFVLVKRLQCSKYDN